MNFCRFIICIVSSITLLGVQGSVNSVFAQSTQPAKTWQRVELRFFSLTVPQDLSLQSSKGIDSDVWTFKGESLTLTTDLGFYSSKPMEDKYEAEYAERRTFIGGKRATIVTFKNRDVNSDGFQYVAAIYFPRIERSGTMKLAVVADCKTSKQIKTAMAIFQSIRFK